jgi:hypothetical protein
VASDLRKNTEKKGVGMVGKKDEARVRGKCLGGVLIEGKGGGGVVEKGHRSSRSPRDHVRKTTERKDGLGGLQGSGWASFLLLLFLAAFFVG